VAVANNIPVALMGWTGFVGIWNFPSQKLLFFL
jgi:hypothetical protein